MHCTIVSYSITSYSSPEVKQCTVSNDQAKTWSSVNNDIAYHLCFLFFLLPSIHITRKELIVFGVHLNLSMKLHFAQLAVCILQPPRSHLPRMNRRCTQCQIEKSKMVYYPILYQHVSHCCYSTRQLSYDASSEDSMDSAQRLASHFRSRAHCTEDLC